MDQGVTIQGTRFEQANRMTMGAEPVCQDTSRTTGSYNDIIEIGFVHAYQF